MKTRMDKYETGEISLSRKERNKKLYDEVSDMNIDYVDINVDNVIDFSSAQKTGTRESYKKQKELNHILSEEKSKKVIEIKEEEKKEERIYDINEILKLARQNKLFEQSDAKKRMINTEYNILTKLDLEEVESNEYSKESLHDLIDTIYEKEKNNTKEEKKLVKEVKEEVEDKKQEEVLEKKEEKKEDLFDDLKDEISLDEEVSKEILDKDTDKEQEKDLDNLEEKKQEEIKENDEEDEDDTDTIEFEIESSSKIALIILFVFIILGAVAFLILNYFKII